METSKTFRDLIVWQKAHRLVLGSYKYSKGFPREEMFGLTSHFRRAVVSIAANIAEGFVKKSNLDKIRFLNIAQGSLEEVRYYLILASDLDYGKDNNLDELATEVSKLINAYINGIRSR